MKKLSFSLLAMLGFFAIVFVSCKDDDEDPVDILPPTVSDPSDTSVDPGATADLSFSVTVPAGFQSSSVASSDESAATATISTNLSNGDESGNLVVTVTGVAEGQSTITLTVTDEQARSANSDVVVTVNPMDMPDMTTVVDTIVAIDDLSSLETAVVAAGLDDDLAGDGPFTIFAPNNRAFDSLIANLDVADLTAVVADLGGVNALAGVLQAHVVADSLPADLIAEQEYATLNASSTITITVEGGNVFANGAQVVGEQIIADNGVIHVIDSVINVEAPALDPGEPNVVRVAASPDGLGAAVTDWTADNTYILDGFIFVNNGQTLNIAPGTIIKGRPGQAARASALIVAKGGTINAAGTAQDPIIFTGEADDLAGSVPDDANALWGGVIILGNATTNNVSTGGLKSVEGVPTEENRGQYGGTDDADNSGTFTYVSIRHGGSLIGSDNEINGLTLGGVGSGTTINNVEVWSNLDDGIEFFGGTVNVSNLVIAYPGDDGIDVDEGYRGNIQKAVVWHTGGTLESGDPRGMELDGGVGANETAMPFTTPNMANLTLVYDDIDGVNLSDAIYMRDNYGGSIYNSIAADHDAPLDIERRTDLGESSYDRYIGGDIVISGNIFFNINGVTDGAGLADLFEISNEEDATLEPAVETYLADNNTIVDPAFGTGAARFTPTAADATTGAVALPESGGFFQTVTYKGAVDPAADTPYFADWTKIWTIIGQ